MGKYLPWTKSAVHKECPNCKKDFICWPYESETRKYCGFSCRSKSQKRWGGKAIKANGMYKRIWNGKKYVPEHRYVMEASLGRQIKRSEIVHHINHDPSDNRIENLAIMTLKDHTALHHKGVHKLKSILGLRKWQKEAPRCGKPIIGWYKRASGAPCQKPQPCPIHTNVTPQPT